MIYKRNPAVEAAPMHEETILYQPVLNKFCVLNKTAAFLWQRLDEPCTSTDLIAAVCTHFSGIESDAAQQDVEAALHDFTELQLVVPGT